MMTEKGYLLYGAQLAEGEELHFDFELRLPTVQDNIDALEEVGGDSNMRLSAAMLARSIIRLGEIPKDSISTDLILGLVDEDYDVLILAQNALKKRRRGLNPASASSAPPVLPLAGTDTAQTA